MSIEPRAPDEARLVEAEHLLAELLARRQAGHDVRLDSLISRRPDLETELRELWSHVDLVDRTLEADARQTAAERARVQDLLRGLAASKEFGERYSVESEIGRGGMGTVLRVRDRKLDRPLAMKLIASRSPAARTIEARQLTRFLNEARITSQLDHPGIVPVHEVGVDQDGRAYFTMKLVQGMTLAEVFERRAAGDPRWSTRRVLGVLQRACEALAFAHGRGVIHRDLKPHNVMVGDFGEVYVMDWGLARQLNEPEERAGTTHAVDEQLAEQTTLTGAGHVLGTPAYMSPEQARGEIERMGPQSDVYAVGAMLYQLIAGHAPYIRPGERASGSEILARIVAGRPPRLVSSTAPRELIAICEKAMSYEREARYASVQELSDELQRFLDDRVVLAFRTGVLVRLTKWVKRNRALSLALASAGLALVLGGVLGVQSRMRADERRFAAAFRRGETALSTDWEGFGPEQTGKRRTAVGEFEQCTKLRPDDRNSWLRLCEAHLRLGEVEPARPALARAVALGANGYYALRLRAWIEIGPQEARAFAVPAGLPTYMARWEAIDCIDRASVLFLEGKNREAYELLMDIEEAEAPSAPTVAGRVLRAQVFQRDAVADEGNKILQDRSAGARLALRTWDSVLRAASGEATIEFNRFVLLFDAGIKGLDLGMTAEEQLGEMDRYAEKRAEEPISTETIGVQTKVAWEHILADLDRSGYARRAADLVGRAATADIARMDRSSFVYLMQVLVVAGEYERSLELLQQCRFEPGGGFKTAGPLHTVLQLYDMFQGKLMDPTPERIEAFLEASHDKVKADDFDAAVAVLEEM